MYIELEKTSRVSEACRTNSANGYLIAGKLSIHDFRSNRLR